MALLGGIAKVDAVIKVSMIAVDRKGQAVRLKSMSIDEDFLGLAPEMLGFNEKLIACGVVCRWKIPREAR